jgi:hypothetical protein
MCGSYDWLDGYFGKMSLRISDLDRRISVAPMMDWTDSCDST